MTFYHLSTRQLTVTSSRCSLPEHINPLASLPVKQTDQKFGFALLAVSVLVISYFIWISSGFHGGGDSLAHYQLAKFSLQYPINLLNHWGKPFFTLLAMPFAQFGFKGIQYFNLFGGVVTSLLAMAIASELKWKYRWVLASLIVFAPIYFQEFFSGLTEVTFAWLLLLVYWLRLKKQFAASLVLLSFLPLVRTEAALFLVWFGLIDLVERRNWQPLLLFTAAIIYSLIGWIAKDNMLWLITEMPYTGGENIYGSGMLTHYLNLMPDTLGWVVLLPALLGTALLPIQLLKGEKDAQWVFKYLLVPSLIYICFHSVMWYVGRVSLGLPRMLAVVAPLFALLAVYGIQMLFSGINRTMGNLLAFAICGFLVWNTFSNEQLPLELGDEEKVLEQAAEFIRDNGLGSHKIHYYSLYNEVSLGLDPHNSEQCQQIVHNRANPHEEVKSGSLVIWDAHFAPNEGAMPLENLTSNEHFEVLKVFKPEPAFNTLGNRPFEVYVFIRK